MINSTSYRAFSTGTYKMNWKGSSRSNQSIDLEYNKKKKSRLVLYIYYVSERIKNIHNVNKYKK